MQTTGEQFGIKSKLEMTAPMQSSASPESDDLSSDEEVTEEPSCTNKIQNQIVLEKKNFNIKPPESNP